MPLNLGIFLLKSAIRLFDSFIASSSACLFLKNSCSLDSLMASIDFALLSNVLTGFLSSPDLMNNSMFPATILSIDPFLFCIIFFAARGSILPD